MKKLLYITTTILLLSCSNESKEDCLFRMLESEVVMFNYYSDEYFKALNNLDRQKMALYKDSVNMSAYHSMKIIGELKKTYK